jgi:hypothetical protein
MTATTSAGAGRRPLDVPILLAVVAAMATGFLAGLARIGYAEAPAFAAERAALHGPLLASGVLGTLIALERAVAFASRTGRRWHPAYAAPTASALGTVWLLVFGATPVAQALLVAGAAALLAVNVAIVRAHPAPETATMAIGAALLLVGDAAWLAGRPIPLLVHWWVAFLVLTIVGERLELARIRRPGPRAVAVYGVAVGAYVAAQAVMLLDASAGIRLSGLAMLGLAAWLLRFDLVRVTIHRSGLPRFAAACLLAGYAWLVVGGVLALANGLLWAGPAYDATLHALLLGFVFSMILAHAPIVVPAILGLRLAYRPFAYVPLVLLQVAVVVRVAGDLLPDAGLRMTGGLLAALAILAELVVVAALAIMGREARRGADRRTR